MAARIVSAIIGIGLFLAACFAGALPFAVAVLIVSFAGAFEFNRGEAGATPSETVPAWAQFAAGILKRINSWLTWLGLVLVPAAYAAASAGRLAAGVLAVLACLSVLFGLVIVLRAWRTSIALGWFRAFYGKVGFWYIGGLFSTFILIRRLPGRIRVGFVHDSDRGAWFMLLVAACIWSSDTFAFFTGRAIGKHKLAPKLSPGKTIEGLIGGLAGAVIVGIVFGGWIGLPWMHGAAIGVIAGLLGPCGDLFESALKRELGIKDFGALMPGHGGVLDRFDSLMFVAPVAYVYLALVVT